MRKNWITLPLAALLLPSCNMLQSNRFTVKNETEQSLSNIRISFADDTFQQRSLAPGTSLSFQPSPDHDGGISLSYTASGKRFDHELGYAAPPISMTCEFSVIYDEVRGDCTQN